MKEPKEKLYPQAESPPLVLREAAAGAIAPTVTVRDAKAQLSALLEWVSGGREITITSAGKPKARLVPVAAEPPRKVFGGMGPFLLGQSISRKAGADEVIREDRDARGW